MGMSKTYEIICTTCKENLWVGQSGYIYTGEPHTMKALTEFLYKHENHDLKFVDSDSSILENCDYQEIDSDDYREDGNIKGEGVEL
jgi:hypothetical protein